MAVRPDNIYTCSCFFSQNYRQFEACNLIKTYIPLCSECTFFQVFSLANDNEENINCSELSSSYWIVSGKGFVFNLQFIELIVIVNLRNSYR